VAAQGAARSQTLMLGVREISDSPRAFPFTAVPVVSGRPQIRPQTTSATWRRRCSLWKMKARDVRDTHQRTGTWSRWPRPADHRCDRACALGRFPGTSGTLRTPRSRDGATFRAGAAVAPVCRVWSRNTGMDDRRSSGVPSGGPCSRQSPSSRYWCPARTAFILLTIGSVPHSPLRNHAEESAHTANNSRCRGVDPCPVAASTTRRRSVNWPDLCSKDSHRGNAPGQATV
jgi:hypothetical protein